MPQPEVRQADAADLAAWDGWVDAAPAPSVFHRLGFLRAMERESGTRLHALVVADEAGPAALLPVFVRGTPPLRLVMSPPPGCAVPELGPLPLRAPASQAEREAAWGPVVEACDRYLRRELRAGSVSLSCVGQVADVRPFTWAGYAAHPVFTYQVPLEEGAAAVVKGWKGQVRTDARRAEKYPELRLESGGAELLGRLVARVHERYREQGREWSPSPGYFDELHRGLNGRLTVRAVLHGDELVAGLGLLVDGGVVRHWFGGATPRGPFIGVNELLHRRVVEEFAERGFHSYELMGANTPSLCRHKARFNPRLVTHFRVERAALPARVLHAVASSPALRRPLRWVLRRGG